jgi:predicted cupin superfamily sugar epimerase
MHPDAASVVEMLQLTPHPEGGHFRETFRAPLVLHGLPHAAPRNASTAIYFLLPAGRFSAFHRVRSDEVWHHLDGDAAELHLIDDGARHTVVRLGHDLRNGERPQCVVPAGVWQATRPVGNRYALFGCTVAPGFDFADFEMPAAGEMVGHFPSLAAVVALFA